MYTHWCNAVLHVVILFYVAIYQTHHSSSTIPPHQPSFHDIYHQLLSRILELLTPGDLHRLCDASPEAQLAGFCSHGNFNRIDLFHYFEQQKLITPNSLGYLRGILQIIGRVDLCGLIVDYTNTYLSGSSLLHGEPVEEQCQPSSYEPCPPPHPPSSYEPRPPPFNPDYCGPSELLCMYWGPYSSPHCTIELEEVILASILPQPIIFTCTFSL